MMNAAEQQENVNGMFERTTVFEMARARVGAHAHTNRPTRPHNQYIEAISGSW